MLCSSTYALEDRLTRYLAAMVGLTVCTVLLSYLLVFPSLVRLRQTHPDVPRPFAVPGGLRRRMALLGRRNRGRGVRGGELIYPGLGLCTPIDAARLVHGSPDRYEQAIALPLAGCLALAALGWLAARRGRTPVSDA